jgi:CRISPR system Cascade subunit CasE
MFLSRLVLDRRSRAVRRDLANPYEMHRTLCRPFSDALKTNKERLLWRVEPMRGDPVVLIQSHTAPDLGAFETGYLLDARSKEFDPQLVVGQKFRFRLKANPTVTKAGKRHALYDVEEQLEWLRTRLDRGGFELLGAIVSHTERLEARVDGKKIVLGIALFDGHLKVADAELARQKLELGLGHGKGLGLGLLSLAKA